MSVQEASKLHADPTYVNSDIEEELCLDNASQVFGCTFYPIIPSLPVYHIQAAPSTQRSSPSLENSDQFKLSNATSSAPDFVQSARDNAVPLDQVSY